MINSNSAICSGILWQELVYFQRDDDDDDDVSFVQDQHAWLYFHSANSLKQQSTDRHVAPFGHIILIPSQPFLLLNDVRLSEMQQIPIL